MTDANAENPSGFWERRDMRQLCDGLLHATGADWWKIHGFSSSAIPYDAVSAGRRRFADIVARLNEHALWALKEPRLCLLLPVLRDEIKKPVCLYVYRNPMEVARSLQLRNGFSIVSALALWEAYNLHALEASAGLPRLPVSYHDLVQEPSATLGHIQVALAEQHGARMTAPGLAAAKQFIDPMLYRRRVATAELKPHLSPTQIELWRAFCEGDLPTGIGPTDLSPSARQSLADLASAQTSLLNLRQERNEARRQKERAEVELVNGAATLKQQAGRIDRLEARAKERADQIARLNDQVRLRQAEIARRDRDMMKQKADLAERAAIIRALHASTSWRVTAPMRVVSRRLRRVVRGLRSVAEARQKGAGAPVTESRSSAIGEQESEKGTAGRIKVSVIAWDLGHNPLGRAYLLADMLRDSFDIELIGANFPRFGDAIWKPLQGCSRVTLRCFPGTGFPEHFHRMQDIAAQIDGDILYVSKPRLPSLELAILAKLHRNRPIILDIDDYELGFFEFRTPLSLEEVETRIREPDFVCPHDEIWTRFSETLIAGVDQVTVSNTVLQARFGGIVVPHARDEADFAPSEETRLSVRQELGFSKQDRVILFAGTPRMHKGIARLIEMLEAVDQPDWKLLVVGAPADLAVQRLFGRVESDQIILLPDVPFSRLPRILQAGDLICLLQDPAAATSEYQMPAKLTDALAMGIPVVATPAPPLLPLAQRGLLTLIDETPLAHQFERIFSTYDQYRQSAAERRATFLSEFSYNAIRPKLVGLIEELAHTPKPVPSVYADLVAWQTRTFPRPEHAPTTGLQTIRSPQSARAPRPWRSRHLVDDKIDIIFLWKQNDTGIYGRRQEMLVKYLAKHDRIHRILHFDAPLSLARSGREALQSHAGWRRTHSGLILRELIARKLGLRNYDNVRFDTIVNIWPRSPAQASARWLRCLRRLRERHRIGERRTLLWVCPVNFDFPEIEAWLEPDLVVADVIDDQRAWPVGAKYRAALGHSYENTLERCHLTLVNCESVLERMRPFASNIHLITNAAEQFSDAELASWRKPGFLRRLKGPIIGYAGNLDINRVDAQLIEMIARARPEWCLVFIGSAHKSGELLRLGRLPNVHFLGVRPYAQALRYIRHFDVAIIPHLDNELTRHMNPLKLYVYFSLGVPVVSSPIANLGDFAEFVRVGEGEQAFVQHIESSLLEGKPIHRAEALRRQLAAHSWRDRSAKVLGLIEDAYERNESGISGRAP